MWKCPVKLHIALASSDNSFLTHREITFSWLTVIVLRVKDNSFSTDRMMFGCSII